MLKVPSPLTTKTANDPNRVATIRLPGLHPCRRLFRWLEQEACRILVSVFTRMILKGVENYPKVGAAVITINHLGDPDIALVLSALPDFPELIGKIDLRRITWLRILGDLTGVIWVQRGQPDRQALRAALTALAEGRKVLIAPEGRESLSGGMEAGTHGAAYLAIKAGVPLVPVAITGSENKKVEKGMRAFHKATVSVTIGKPFFLIVPNLRSDNLETATRVIMTTLAGLLPPAYRGVYAQLDEISPASPAENIL